MAGSSNEVVESTSSQLITNYDVSKLLIRSTRFVPEVYENTTGGDVELKCGMLVGKVSATGKIVPHASGNADGSEIPYGVIILNETVADTESVDVDVCVSGELEKELVILDAGDTFDTVIAGRRLFDRIMGDTRGLLLVETTENTDFDNQ